MWRFLLNIVLLVTVSTSAHAKRKFRDEGGYKISIDSTGALSVKAREGRGDRDLLLYGNNISSIGPNAFDNLTLVTIAIIRPRRVNLDRRWKCKPNHIAITPESFNGLPSIESIFMVRVHFRNAFNSSKTFGSLKSLLFDNNGLTEIPQEFCVDSPKLEYLIVRYQHIRTLSPASFARMNTEVLKELLLEFNGLESVEPQTFARFRHLKILDLSDNSLEILRRGVFGGLDELEKLWVVNNSLRHVEPGIFSGLKNLRLLDLRDNRLTTLPSGIFDELKHLEKLELFGNAITAVTGSLLQATHELSYLSLGFSERIQIEPNAFQGLSLNFFLLNGDQMNYLSAGAFGGLTTEVVWLRRKSILNFKPNLFENLTITIGFVLYEPEVTLVDRKSWGLDSKIVLRSNPLYMFGDEKTHLY